MTDPWREGAESFRRYAGMFQQMAGAFPGPRSLQHYAIRGTLSPLETLVEAVRSGLVGRTLETSVTGRLLTLTLTGVEARIDPFGGSAGQADDVELSAENVVFGDVELDSATVRLGNVHTRVRRRPALVCAPVEISADLGWSQVVKHMENHVPWLDVDVSHDGRLRLRGRRRARRCWIEVEPSVESGRLTLRPLAVGSGRLCRQLRGQWRSWTIPLELPANVRLIALAGRRDGLRIDLRMDEWHVGYDRIIGLVGARGDDR